MAMNTMSWQGVAVLGPSQCCATRVRRMVTRRMVHGRRQSPNSRTGQTTARRLHRPRRRRPAQLLSRLVDPIPMLW